MNSRNFIHQNAIVEPGAEIGESTRVWAFAHILPHAKIGRDCNICDHVFIENDVQIGDRVTIKCGVQIWDGISIEDDVFIGPNATFTNDKHPRSKVYPENFLRTVVKKGASIGANATILPGIVIGEGSMIGAGAVVTRSVPPNAIVVGNPARIVGYVNTPNATAGVAPLNQAAIAETGVTHSSVDGVTLHRFSYITDMRGSLTVGEFEKAIPFTPKRYFMVFDVPSVETRGEHAHRLCHQFLVCAAGSCVVVADDGSNRQEFLLDRQDIGLYLPPMTWGIQYKYTKDAVLLVFASEFYDPNDYIREYSEFLDLVRGKKNDPVS